MRSVVLGVASVAVFVKALEKRHHLGCKSVAQAEDRTRQIQLLWPAFVWAAFVAERMDSMRPWVGTRWLRFALVVESQTAAAFLVVENQ